MIPVPSSGPCPARVMIVGEAPGADEEYHRTTFAGRAGHELTQLLHEAGFIRAECFITNVVKYRPPKDDLDHFIHPKKTNPPAGFVHYLGHYVDPCVVTGVEDLYTDIERVRPDLIICLGNTALWAVSNGTCLGVGKWRGSQLSFHGAKVIPTYHPTTILRQWSFRAIALADLRRAAGWLAGEAKLRGWRFLVRPSFEKVMWQLKDLSTLADQSPLLLSVDLETRAGHIACCGIAWSMQDAISIPLMCVENPDGYWDLEQETTIVLTIRSLLTHPNVSVVGQNFSYDAQYIHRHWHFTPNVRHDTMLAQGTLWPGLPKALDFLASMYCRHYIYWKDDGKEWDTSIPEEQYWSYNCEDACRTYEVIRVQLSALEATGLLPQYTCLMRRWFPVQQMMRTGVRINKPLRGEMAIELMSAMSERESWFTSVLGHPLNPRSSKQMQALFYDDLRVPIQRNRKTGNASLDDKALTKIQTRVPILTPLIKTISDYRSIGVFLSTFVQAPLDTDGRMRCSYNIVGAETFRFSSSENAFGSGTNLQNIPKGNEAPKPGELSMPNIRRLFIPDPGYTIADADLDRADLQVVVWESDDDELKQALREGIDIHSENARTLGISRALAKSWVHGTNYGGGPRTMAINCGITVHQAELMQRRWFAAHPGIKAWHDRTLHSLQTTRSVRNRFGFRRFYFDRIEGLLPEALAWIPQSTVAHIIDEALFNISFNLPEVDVLLQVHDSLVFQFPTHKAASLLPQIKEQCRIPVPYEDPLIIPVGLKTSTISWGDCKDASWGG